MRTYIDVALLLATDQEELAKEEELHSSMGEGRGEMSISKLPVDDFLRCLRKLNPNKGDYALSRLYKVRLSSTHQYSASHDTEQDDLCEDCIISHRACVLMCDTHTYIHITCTFV
jgi:hypothetical protein